MKIAFMFNARFSGILAKLTTGCFAFHVAWVDEETNTMYDMNFIRRKRPWPYYPNDEVVLFDAPPQITREYLEQRLRDDTRTYGIFDYVMFVIRPIGQVFGMRLPNTGGIICSEMINNDMHSVGIQTPWAPTDPPPSPCDLFRYWINLNDHARTS